MATPYSQLPDSFATMAFPPPPPVDGGQGPVPTDLLSTFPLRRIVAEFNEQPRSRNLDVPHQRPPGYTPASFRQRYPTPPPSPPPAPLPQRLSETTVVKSFASSHSSSLGTQNSNHGGGLQFTQSTSQPMRLQPRPAYYSPRSTHGFVHFKQEMVEDLPDIVDVRPPHRPSTFVLGDSDDDDDDDLDPATTKSSGEDTLLQSLDTSLTPLNSMMGGITLRQPRSISLKAAIANAPINSTISRDNTAGEHARQAELLAHFGTRLRHRSAGTSGSNPPHQATSQTKRSHFVENIVHFGTTAENQPIYTSKNEDSLVSYSPSKVLPVRRSRYDQNTEGAYFATLLDERSQS